MTNERNGEFLAKSTLLTYLGGKRAIKSALGLDKTPYKKVTRFREDLPSPSRVNEANDLELQEITRNIENSTEDLISSMETKYTDR